MGEPDRSHKHVPSWSGNWSEQLAKQENVDPDSIFASQVPTCNIDLIFPDALYKECGAQPTRRKRGSSCMWDKDRLRKSEVVAYRQKMGQQRRWSVLHKNMRNKLIARAASASEASSSGAAG